MNTVAKSLLACATLTLITSCSDTASDPLGPAIQLSAAESRLVAASGGFGFDLYRRIAANEASPNLFISPLSVSMALGMTMNGAAYGTLAQMRATLGFADLSEQDVNDGYRSVIEQLVRRDRAVTVRLANSMWPDDDLTVLAPFTNTLRSFFNAEVRPLDFSDGDGAVRAINQWTDQATQGKIKKLFDQLEANTRLVLVNAIYFKAPWTDEFKVSDTRDEPFTRADGSVVSVPMMRRTGSYRIRRNQELLAVEVPYAHDAFSMVLVRPLNGSLAALEQKLNAGWWAGLLEGMPGEKTLLRLPRFKIEYGKQLNEPLMSLGMTDAFSAAAADFSRITGSRSLFVSRVEHKAFVEVNEQGTEAAAVTGVVMTDSGPLEASFDRPFLFAIRERESGVILFMGRVGDPTLK